MNTKTDNNKEFLAGMLEIKQLVASTMGYYGRTVTMCGGDSRKTYNDGAQIIRQFIPKGELRREAVLRIRDAATATRIAAGDGTSATTVIAATLYEEGLNAIEKGATPRDVVSCFREWAARGAENIAENAIKVQGMPIEQQEKVLASIARVAMKGHAQVADDIGRLVARLGEHGSILAEPSYSGEVEVETIPGFMLAAGAKDESFFNTRNAATYRDALVLMANEHLESFNHQYWAHIMQAWNAECVERQAVVPLVIIAQSFAGSVLSTFTARERTAAAGGGKLPYLLIALNGGDSYDVMEDLSAVIGGTVFDAAKGKRLEDFHGMWTSGKPVFGRAQNVSAYSDRSVLSAEQTVGAALDKEARKDFLAAAIEGAEPSEADGLRRRLANMNGAIGIIRIPMVTETAFSDTQERVEDAYSAAFSSWKYGVLPGCGVGLFDATDLGVPATECEEAWNIAMKAVAVACISNAPAHIVNLWNDADYPKSGQTFDLASGRVVDAVEDGILDSAFAVMEAVKNAVSVVCPILETKYFLFDE